MKTEVNGNQRLIKVQSLIFIVALLVSNLIFTRSVAQQHTPWVTPKASLDVKNPIQVDNTVLAEGKQLYATNCAPCHGNKGKGDGPAASALTPKPADHTSAVVQNET